MPGDQIEFSGLYGIFITGFYFVFFKDFFNFCQHYLSPVQYINIYLKT